MCVEYGMNNNKMLAGTSNADKAIIEWTSAMFANLMTILVGRGVITREEALKISDDTTKFLEKEGEQKK